MNNDLNNVSPLQDSISDWCLPYVIFDEHLFDVNQEPQLTSGVCQVSPLGDLVVQPDSLPEWEQQRQPDTCAVCCELSIINQFGHDLTQEQAAYISSENGWYHTGGTYPEDIGKLMELHDIPNHTVYNATVANLMHELQAGHGVIIGVNAEELGSEPLEQLMHAIRSASGLDNSLDTPANHAVVVTGIDVSDPENIEVIINDPGRPTGEGARYPLNQFKDAWENSNFYYTATDIPMPGADVQALGSIDVSSGMSGIVGLLTLLDTGDVATATAAGAFTHAVCNFIEEVFSDPRIAAMV